MSDSKEESKKKVIEVIDGKDIRKMAKEAKVSSNTPETTYEPPTPARPAEAKPLPKKTEKKNTDEE